MFLENPTGDSKSHLQISTNIYFIKYLKILIYKNKYLNFKTHCIKTTKKLKLNKL